MRTIFICLLLCYGFKATCQKDTVFIRYNKNDDEKKVSYKTDTVLFPSQMHRTIIHGTMALPGSIGQRQTMITGLALQNMTGTDCESSMGEEPLSQDEITDIRQTDSTLEIETKIAAPCCVSFLGDVAIVGDSILQVNYSIYGSICDCPCCYGLTYRFDFVADYEALRPKIKWVEINSEKKTLKPIKFSKLDIDKY